MKLRVICSNHHYHLLLYLYNLILFKYVDIYHSRVVLKVVFESTHIFFALEHWYGSEEINIYSGDHNMVYTIMLLMLCIYVVDVFFFLYKIYSVFLLS